MRDEYLPISLRVQLVCTNYVDLVQSNSSSHHLEPFAEVKPGGSRCCQSIADGWTWVALEVARPLPGARLLVCAFLPEE